METPQPTYLKQGDSELVQLSAQEWENFVLEFERVKTLLYLKKELQSAFEEIRDIKSGKKKPTILADFLKNDNSHCRR